MATLETFQVGEGHYALAYGKHIVKGILAGLNQTDPNNVKIKILMGLGEWDAIEELTYEGAIISPSNFTFHPGTASTGKTDPLQGEDTRFPSGIYHHRIAYYSATLPDGLGSDGTPDAQRAIARCLKINNYDASGNLVSYGYSVNPADVFADLVRRNAERLGYDFASAMDWQAYHDARVYYAQTFAVDDGKYTPKEIQITRGSTGSLSAGFRYYRVSALKNSPASESAASAVKLVDTLASGANTITWKSVDGADKYRVYFGSSPSSLSSYFETTSTAFTHSTDTGASSGTPLDLPSGDWSVSAPRFESHRAFTTTDILTADALTAVMFDAASEWTMDGGKFRIITPETRTAQHRFTVDNTLPGSFSYWKIPPRERVNQVSTVFRQLDDWMKPGEDSPANDFEAQSKFGIIEEQLVLGSKRRNEQRRIAFWRLADMHQRPRRVRLVGDLSSQHLLTTDVVTVADRQAGVREQSTMRIFSSLSAVSGLAPGAVEWVLEDPHPHGSSASLKVTATASNASFSANFSAPVVLTDDSIFETSIFVDPENVPTEIAFEFGSDKSVVSASLRVPQIVSQATGDVMRIGVVPPAGAWIPVKFALKDIGLSSGDEIGEITGRVIGGIAAFTEMFVREEAGRDYKIVEIEDSGDEATFTLYEYNPNAYSDNPS